MKKTSGFTLVELIVVIAILAILAGIAIPVYSNYIAKANEAADYQKLDAIKTAAVFAAVDQDHDFGTIKTIEVAATDGVISTITITDNSATPKSFSTTNDAFKTELQSLLGGTDFGGKLQAYKSGATWSASTGKWA